MMKSVVRISGKVVSVETFSDHSDIPPEAYCRRCGGEHKFMALAPTGQLIFWCHDCRTANVVDPWPGNHDTQEDSARLQKWAAQLK